MMRIQIQFKKLQLNVLTFITKQVTKGLTVSDP